MSPRLPPPSLTAFCQSTRTEPLVFDGFTGHSVPQPQGTSPSRHRTDGQLSHQGCTHDGTSSWEPSCSDGCHSTCLPVLHSMGMRFLGTAVLLKAL